MSLNGLNRLQALANELTYLVGLVRCRYVDGAELHYGSDWIPVAARQERIRFTGYKTREKHP